MKDIFAMFVVVFGSLVLQWGYNMMSPETQDEFSTRLYEKLFKK